MNSESTTGNILHEIDPTTLGVFWITEDNLSKRPQPFYEFDYVMDGLLTQCLRQNTKQDGSFSSIGKNLFVSKNFGEPFFIGHIAHGNTNAVEEIKQMLEVLNNLDSNKRKILIHCNDDVSLIKKLKNNFKKFNFDKLKI